MNDREHISRQSGKQQRDAKLPDSVKARRCAALAVMDVRANGKALEIALAATEDYAGLEARDRAFARAIAATVFRRSGQIKAVLKPHVRKKPTAPVQAVLETAVAQIVFMGLDLTVTKKREDLAKATGGTPVGRQTLRLDSIGDVTALPGFEDGTWWAQDLAAAQPAQILMSQFEDVAGMRVLDLCAAPGGKTLQLAAAGMDVTAVDKSAGRLKRLEENLARTKLNAKIVRCDALDYKDEQFPAVLLDAPCSATGTFRRHPDVLHNRSPKSVADLVRLQDKLLPKAAALTAPGGVLVYAVCSLQPDEAMPRITKFLENAPDFRLISIPALPGLDLPAARFTR